ncbi:MAG: DNA polymerase III subunit delta [Candidatus Krumholzibacteriia bacterium]
MGYRKGKTAALPGLQELVGNDLKTGNFRPLYVLAGEDTLRAEQVVERIRRDALGEQGAAFNYHVLQGDQADIGRVLQQAYSLPMFAGRQVIWVKHAERLLANQEAQDRFEAYAQKPVQETILILSAEKVDRRKKWVKACSDAGFLFDFSPPTGEALVQWVVKAARKEGLPLGPQEAGVLCDLVGNDLMSLKSEIDKLALLAEDRGTPLDAREIAGIIMDQAALEGYEITANLAPGHAAEVLRTWFRLQEWGRTAYEIAPLVLARVRRGALLDACRRAGWSDQEIGAATAQNPWSFRYYEPMVRGLGPAGLRRALAAALACDRAMKSSPLKPDIILEKTIAELCTAPAEDD